MTEEQVEAMEGHLLAAYDHVEDHRIALNEVRALLAEVRRLRGIVSEVWEIYESEEVADEPDALRRLGDLLLNTEEPLK